MHLLVSAGNTLVSIDRVRYLTNPFTGRTGTEIALRGYDRGHRVTLLTSRPQVIHELRSEANLDPERWQVVPFQTFDDLHRLLAERVPVPGLDALVLTAAVSDYRAVGVYAPGDTTRFDNFRLTWHDHAGTAPELLDRSAGKIKSEEPELWVRLVRTPKLVDFVRVDWHFGGILVKFKLEVGLDDAQLLQVAERSRRHSSADLMVANTLDDAANWAYLGPLGGVYRRIERPALAASLLDVIEALHRERTHG